MQNKKKKIAVGSWAFGLPLEETFKIVDEIGFDGIAIGFFPPYGVRRDTYNTPEKEATVKNLAEHYGLEIASCGIDMYSAHALLDTGTWLEEFEKNISFVKRLDVTNVIRVDTGVAPVLPPGFEYDDIKREYKNSFKKIARCAAKYGITLVWEFEPGFIINEPDNIIDVVKWVDEPNFKLCFDTCHAYNCMNGVNHIEKGKKLKGGLEEFIERCEGLIGLVHLIDSDGSLQKIGIDVFDEHGARIELETSRHLAFGEGYINFDVILPALVDIAKYSAEWWVIDMEKNPVKYAKTAFEYVTDLNYKLFC
ncbi:MAG: sugar phosphate isomerase/epimerase [Oscillospiraceae bacterium]|nr:sugar phosphate isomerase/epimerase [Oscillospiraceae bacterium]